MSTCLIGCGRPRGTYVQDQEVLQLIEPVNEIALVANEDTHMYAWAHMR